MGRWLNRSTRQHFASSEKNILQIASSFLLQNFFEFALGQLDVSKLLKTPRRCKYPVIHSCSLSNPYLSYSATENARADKT